MRKFINLVALAVLWFAPAVAWAQNQTVTVCDGTATNEYVPFYGYYADEAQNGQMIYPADSLTAMAGRPILSMKFYISETGWGQGVNSIGNWIVSLGTVGSTTLSGINTSVALTQVYSGAMSFNGDESEMTVTFTTPYVYSGGNLLVEFNHPNAASYHQITFQGVTANGASYCYNNQRNFLPKVSFECGAVTSCMPVNSITATGITSDGLTLNWIDTNNSGATYSIDYWAGTDTLNVTTSSTSYTFTGLDANTTYHFAVKAVCSASDESVALTSSVRTACGGSTCDITLQLGSTVSYYDPWSYGAQIQLWQNNEMLAATSNSGTIEVCGSSPVTVRYSGATYSFYDSFANITVLDGGGATVYSGGSGDSLTTIANPCPSCIMPTALTIDSLGQTDVILSWTPRSGATLFAVYQNNTLVDGNVNDTTYTFTGLSANTAYTFGVQALCTGDDSSNIATIIARTACGEMSLPISVDFEDADFNGAWYPCWDSTIAAGTDPSVNNVRNHTTGGTYAMYLQAKGSESYNLVVGPTMDASGDNIYCRFWAYRQNGWIKAGVITNPRDTSTFIPLVTIENASGWNEYEFSTDTLDPTADYRVAWLAYYNSPSSSGTQIGEIDDIYISEIPNCPRVISMALDTVTSDEITVSWPDNGNGSFTLYYWPAGSTDTLYVSASDTTATITGLDGMTAYQMYVVSNCSGGEGEPSPTYTFATNCADAVCNVTLNMVDSYGDGWNGNAIQVYQAGVMVGEGTISSGNSNTETVEVCSTAEVELRYVSGSYPSEMQGNVTDGGGNIIFTIANMGNYTNGAVLATTANPCPQCVPPTNITVTDITADGATVSWTPQDGQSSWIVQIDSLYYNVNDTFYTFTGLNARTGYTVSVATDCSGDTSAFITTTFTTDCSSGSCDITVDMADSFGDGWNGASINFYQNGTLVGSANLSSGNSGIATVNVCSGIPVTYSWQSGNFDSECSYVIYDGGDAELYTSATGGINHSDSVANACPSCITPDSLVLSLLDSNELEFAWRVIDSVYGYLVSFNGGPWESAIGSYNAYSLTPNTSYTFSVMAVCQIGDTSNARTITVKTACGQMVLPLVEDFESETVGNMPSCWSTTVTNAPAIETGYAHSGDNHFAFTGISNAATSAVPLNGDSIYVSFWALLDDYYVTTLEAGVMTNPLNDSSFIPMLTITSAANAGEYTLYEFNTSNLYNYYDSTFYVAFRSNGSSYAQAFIDDINIHRNEGCMYPANLTATPAVHSVALTWSNSSSSADFAVQQRVTGTTAWDTTYTTVDTSYTVNGLLAATNYEFRVGFICNTDTLWSYVSALTSCELLSVPYFENFFSATGELPPCWDYTSPVGWNNWPLTSGNGELMFGGYSAGVPAVLPEFASNFSKLQITFYTKCRPDSEGDGILIGVADASGNLISWIDTLYHPNHSQAAWVEHTYNFLNYSGPGARIALGRKLNGASNLWCAIDSITVIALEDCVPIDSLRAHNIIDPDHTSFSWIPQGTEIEWDVYVDTVTVAIDSVADSLFTTISTTSYEIPMGTIQGGGIYKFYVRAHCNNTDQSNWVSYEFGAGTVIMNNSATADTVVACGLVVYDNGGPVAGYLDYSNSALVIYAENTGSELQIFGGKFGWGDSPITLTVYDGVGSGGTQLYQITNTGTTTYNLLDTILATSTTGAMTITFNCSGNYVHTGYELYIHCVGAALCERPTQLNAVMTEVGEATVTWHGTSAAYDLYYKPTGATNWTIASTTADSLLLTGLIPDTTYDMQVVGICGNDTSTPSFPIVLNTHYNIVITPCDPISGLTVTDVTNTSAVLSWTSNGSNWEIEVVRIGLTDTVVANTNPYTLTGLLPNMQYTVRVRTACSGVHVDPYSEWSAAETFTTPLDGPQSYTLTVAANNDAWGTVTGGGTYVDGSQATLIATANEGYYFDRWNDGDTNATRIVTVTGNATYTANFAEDGTVNNYYIITVSANNDAWGTVSGGGEYAEGSTATITATANSGYHFVEWNDGNTDNPRTFTVIASGNYTATFAPNTGIDEATLATMTLFPNPASSTVTVRLEGFEGMATIEVIDLSGKRVSEFRTQDAELQIDLRQLVQGAYFIRVTGEKATAVSRLIVR